MQGDRYVQPLRFSRNQEVNTLHVSDAQKFVDGIEWRVVPGDTLLFDFVFFMHPTAIGHWWEMLGPLYRQVSGHCIGKCAILLLLSLKQSF